ncbi:MAG TPA: DUF4190 domain-containing protein [Tepidisphaeraceae bacterium]|nr:DUF4190 domain-containing protein [Tepidisphaeraceae bacterium]HUB24010.1 DUF4190 domain-containing protein [Tepidisphaeraceae bacterium]
MSQQTTDPGIDQTTATEHLTRLPRMSTTAGVGTQEYVAVNPVCVFALLLGFASVLSIIDDSLLVIPITAVVLAIIAMRQIAQSNGTQTGRGIAQGGLFLAIAYGSFVLSGGVLESYGRYQDRQDIAKLCVRFGEDLKDRTYDDAYSLFSQRFQHRIDRQTFVRTLKSMQDELTEEAKKKEGLGPVNGAHWNGLVHFYADPDSGTVTAQSIMLWTFELSPNPYPKTCAFRKSANGWEFDDIFELFPTKKAAGR